MRLLSVCRQRQPGVLEKPRRLRRCLSPLHPVKDIHRATRATLIVTSMRGFRFFAPACVTCLLVCIVYHMAPLSHPLPPRAAPFRRERCSRRCARRRPPRLFPSPSRQRGDRHGGSAPPEPLEPRGVTSRARLPGVTRCVCHVVRPPPPGASRVCHRMVPSTHPTGCRGPGPGDASWITARRGSSRLTPTGRSVD